MEESGYTWHFWALVGCAISALLYGLSRMYFGGKTLKRMGATGENIKQEDCEEATSMIVDYLNHSLWDQGRARGFAETSAGCDSLTVLRKSREIAEVIKEVHLYGGRLVLRKVDDRDIEDARNTPLEVKKYLTGLDIARAKRVERKYRR